MYDLRILYERCVGHIVWRCGCKEGSKTHLRPCFDQWIFNFLEEGRFGCEIRESEGLEFETFAFLCGGAFRKDNSE